MISPQRLPQSKRVYSANPIRKNIIRPMTHKQPLLKTELQNLEVRLDNNFFDPYKPVINDEFGESELIRSMRMGQKQKFIQLYKEQFSQSRVNQFMYNVYIYGKQWSPQMKVPEFLNACDSSGKTLLHYAAAGDANLEEGYFQQLLQKFGGKQDSRGITALMIAAVHGNLRAVKALIPIEACIQDVNGCSALMCAAKYRQNVVIDQILPFECVLSDKNGFIFADYLPSCTEQSYILHINQNMKKFFKDFQSMEIAKKLEKKQEPPNFLQIRKDYEATLREKETWIKEQITASSEKLNEDIAQMKDTLFEEISIYIHQNQFQQLQFELQNFISQKTQYLSTIKELGKDDADKQLGEVDDFLKNQNISLFADVSKIRLRYKANIEKIHLQLLYSTNELHEKFDKIFEDIDVIIKQQKDQLIDYLQLYNKLTYLDMEYATQREQVQKAAAQYILYNESVYKTVKSAYLHMLEDVHTTLDNKVDAKIKQIMDEYAGGVKKQQDELKLLINDKMMSRISDDILMQLKISITQSMTQSQFPDIDYFKDFLNCVIFIFKQKQKAAMFYDQFADIVLLAQQYLSTDDGLFDFVIQQTILPVKCFASLKTVDEYFRFFAESQFKFTYLDILKGLIKQVRNTWNQQMELQFVRHCLQFFKKAKPDSIPSLLTQRLGTLSRKKLFAGDNVAQSIDLNFAYFYLSVIGIMHGCEMVEYKKVTDVQGFAISTEEEYKGTFKQLLDPKLYYSCRCPGWMRVVGMDPEIVIDPLWEENI